MMESTNRTSIWGRHTFLVITGASRGIGRTLAIEFAQLIKENSTILLLARSIENLEETKRQILQIQPNINVEVQSVDLSKPNGEHYSKLLSASVKNSSYDLYLLVHNAASIVVDTPADEMDDLNKWNEYMTTNLFSATILTSRFLKLFKKSDCCIVNISSLAATKPIKGMAMYCAGKASRELFFKVIASENPTVNVLNYSPGPIETDMHREIMKHCCFPDVIEQFNELRKTGLVKVEDSVHNLISILKEQNYENGASIDYFWRTKNS